MFIVQLQILQWEDPRIMQNLSLVKVQADVQEVVGALINLEIMTLFRLCMLLLLCQDGDVTPT